jgi:hypothetical protein
MDRTLLQTEDPKTSEHVVANDQHETLIEEARQQEQQQYRDLAIDTPILPLRVTLNPPLEYDGETFHELILDFESMTGKDFQRAEREFTHLYKTDRNEAMPLPEMKHLYHAIIAKNLANVPLGVIYKLPRRIYVPLRLEVLKACGSSPEEERV